MKIKLSDVYIFNQFFYSILFIYIGCINFLLINHD